MSLEEKAKEYALKALESEIDKVQKAYIDGYNAAKADEPFIDENGIKWYDMDLPSGNLWSTALGEYVINTNGSKSWVPIQKCYNEVKDLSLPTRADIDELLQHTYRASSKSSNYLSVNGVSLYLTNWKYWYKGDAAYPNACVFDGHLVTSEDFIGQSNKIILIKRKN